MSSIVDVSERKVRPIYEAIEIANYKSALSQCNKLLKKQPEALILKALKALILERTGKAEEALQLCAQVKEKKPIDEAVLQAITMVYRSLGKNDEIVQIYEIAARLNPNNEELGNHWFMAIVRNNDFKGQQQAALKLHKVFKVNRYYFWAIMSSVLQAENAPASQSAIFLTLAERMMQKAVQEKRLKHTEEVHLYMIVLLTQNKIKEALEVLEGLKDDLAVKCGEDTEMIHIRNDLLLKTENWTKAIEASKLSLGTNSDDWRAYLTYLHSLFQLIELNKKDENGESLDKVPNLDDAREYLYSLQKKELESNDVKRGPFLAELELEKRIISEKKDSKPAKDMNTLVIEYARKFGDKSSCFEDLQPYLKDFSLETSKKFIEEYNASIDNTCEDKKSKIRNVQKNVNSYKLERYLGLLSDINENDAIAYVDKLWLLYKDALPYGSELLDTENQYSDEFVILASHMLIDLHNRKGQNSFLFQAIFLLEKALDKSKNNFQFKLILIRLYEALGNYLKPLELYKTMDIKHVQLDTMSHYICARSSSFAFYEEATQACYDTLPIYRSNEVETPEMIVQAYKYATFSKIQEFIQFRKELDNSMQKVLVDREVIRLEFLSVSKDLKSAMEYLERELDISDLNYDDSFCTSRYDNRDFAVIINYNSPNTKSIEEITSVSPKLDNTWLKIFSIIPQILKVMHTNNNIDDVIILIERLENLTNLEDKEVGITLEERHMGKIVVKLGRLFIIFKEVQAGQKESIEKLSKIVDEITSALKDNSTEEFSEIKVQEISWKHMHRFSTFLETCNYIIIVNKIINEMLNTKNKKSANKELIQTLQVLMTSVKENLESTKKQLTGLKEKIKDEEENLLSYIKSENKCIEFCGEEENLSFIKEILVNKVSLSWQTSIQNMIKAIEFRI